MTFTNRLYGYDPLGLVPKIVIIDRDAVTQYTYEAKQVAADPENPVQDLQVESWHLHGGVGNDHGYAEIVIDDKDNVLTDGTLRAKSTIKNQWQVKLYLGKRNTAVPLWFDSRNHGVRVIRPSTNSQKIRLFAIGDNIRNYDRLINCAFFQNKESDGETLDATDSDAKLSEIFKKIIQDSQNYAYPALGTEGFTVSGVEDIDIKLPNYIKRYVPASTALSELANIGYSHYGRTPAGDMFLRHYASQSANMIVTNDLDSLDWQNWDIDRKMVLRNAPNWFEDGTIEAGIPFLYNVDAQNVSKDYEQTSSNAIFDTSAKWVAIPWVPTQPNLNKIALYLSKVGTPLDMNVSIIGDNSGPDASRVYLTQQVKAGRLADELGSAKYLEIPFDKIAIEPNTTYYIMVPMFGDGSNYIGIDYQTGTGTYYDSADGSSWTSRTGDFKFRTYKSLTEVIIFENTVSRKSFPDRERLVDLGGLSDEDLAIKALMGLSESVGKERRTYSGIIATAPTDPLELGKLIKIYDKFNGMSIMADLVGFDLGGSAFDGDGFGCNTVELTIEEYVY